MKTTKITTTLASLTMIFFMSTSSMANLNSRYSGDGVKTSVKNHISAVNTNMGAAVQTTISSNEFSHLRFDVNNFVTSDKSEISELPLTNQFQYLRFDVNNFSTSDITEVTGIPSNEFEYLRFDANNFESENAISTNELVAK